MQCSFRIMFICVIDLTIVLLAPPPLSLSLSPVLLSATVSFWLSLKEAQHLTSLYYCVNTRDTYTQCRASRSEFLRLSISIPVAIIMRIVFKWLSWSKFPFLQCSIHITCVRLSPRVEKLEFFHACAMVNMRARTHARTTHRHTLRRSRALPG